MGPIQVYVHAVCLVDQLIDLPNSALKVTVFARAEALQNLYLRHSPVASLSKKMNLFGTGITGVLTLFEYAIKSCIRASILNV